jgi:hypothetical protein
VSDERWWTVEEANAVLPRVTELVEGARLAAEAARAASAGLAARVRSNGHGSLPADLSPIQAAIDELAADAIVLRDVDRGLIDFPARTRAAREYWLCWVVGEPSVVWWHWPEDGFSGRTPITDLPE